MSTLTLVPKNVKPLSGSVVSPKDMGEASKVGRVVYVAADGLMYEATATAAISTTGQIGLIVAGGKADVDGDVAASERVSVLWFGRVALGVTLDETKQYYLANTTSTVKGLIGDAAGDSSRRLGKPEGPDVFFFNPEDVATAS